MAKKRGKIYIIAHRRRREGRTNYRKRLALLKSGKPRLVVRRSTNNMECQIVKHRPEGDLTVVSVNSVHLRGLGWKAGTGNVPSAYLIGMMCGAKAREKGIKEAVLDTGVVSPTKGSRIYAALKGAVDAGLSVEHSEEILPAEERLKGEHIANYLNKYSELPAQVEEIKAKILGGARAKKKAGRNEGKAKKKAKK